MKYSETNFKYALHWHKSIKPNHFFSEMAKQYSDLADKDVYGNSKVLQAFENEMALEFGKEAAIFLPSGTMLQPMLARIIADQTEKRHLACHPTCHLELHEESGIQHLHNIQLELIGKKEELIALEDIKNISDKVSVCLLELPQREIGGRLPSFNQLKQQSELLKQRGIWRHMDGARIWEAAAGYGKSLKELSDLFDSVYVSFYKGIGGISGSMLLSTSDIINQAKVWNRRLGGNLYTQFPVYLSAMEGLKKRKQLFPKYFEKTTELVGLLKESFSEIKFFPETPQVNMIHLEINKTPKELNDKTNQYLEKTGTKGLHFRPAGKNNSQTEWYFGDLILEVPSREVLDYFRYILSSAPDDCG